MVMATQIVRAVRLPACVHPIEFMAAHNRFAYTHTGSGREWGSSSHRFTHANAHAQTHSDTHIIPPNAFMVQIGARVVALDGSQALLLLSGDVSVSFGQKCLVWHCLVAQRWSDGLVVQAYSSCFDLGYDTGVETNSAGVYGGMCRPDVLSCRSTTTRIGHRHRRRGTFVTRVSTPSAMAQRFSQKVGRTTTAPFAAKQCRYAR